ncbi:50S ribosomal protein L37ae [Candidatus Micrarchaeota archaeon]|nr:50S ribosomal protein L37ae [Candidatus Micrarchaeota archaeon]
MGSRYGRTIRKKESEVLALQRAKHVCPVCGKKNVKRVSNALWKCRSCNSEFAGGAYTPETAVGQTARKFLEGA